MSSMRSSLDVVFFLFTSIRMYAMGEGCESGVPGRACDRKLRQTKYISGVQNLSPIIANRSEDPDKGRSLEASLSERHGAMRRVLFMPTPLKQIADQKW
jgi:hypothetical protein